MNVKQIFFSCVLLAYFGNFPSMLAVSGNPTSYNNTEIKVEASIDSYYVNSSAPIQNKDVAADFDEFPNLHPMVVHFPIVLLIFAAVLQLFQIFRLNRTLDWVVLLLIGSGFIGAYIAANFVHPNTEGLTDAAKNVLELHDTYATWVIWSSAAGAVLKLGSLFALKQNRIFEIVVSLVILLSAYTVSQAGHYGSQLVYIEGVGPQGKYLGTESEDGHEESGGHSH